jgi:hypothetical protein
MLSGSPGNNLVQHDVTLSGDLPPVASNRGISVHVCSSKTHPTKDPFKVQSGLLVILEHAEEISAAESIA